MKHAVRRMLSEPYGMEVMISGVNWKPLLLIATLGLFVTGCSSISTRFVRPERPPLPVELSEPCEELDDLPEPLAGAGVSVWIEQAITRHGECAIKADKLIEAYSG